MNITAVERTRTENNPQEQNYFGSNAPAQAEAFPAELRTDAFPPESCEEFSTSPFSFQESTKMLWEDTQLTYQHACTANRFTDNYLNLCGRLEKNIKQLGSLCVTKAVLEQRGLSFPDLAGMEINELIGMVSYHLRKCHAAFRSIYQFNQFFGMSYLNWEFRWVELGNRLRSTDVKIQNILAGKVNIKAILQRENLTRLAIAQRSGNGGGTVPSLPANPAAMPIKGSLVREILREQKEAEKREKEKEKLFNDLNKIWGGNNTCSVGFAKVFEKSSGKEQSPGTGDTLRQKPAPEGYTPGKMPRMKPVFPNCEPGRAAEFITAEEARKILMEDAEKRGDSEALEEIRQEDEYRLEDRWIDFLEDPPEE